MKPIVLLDVDGVVADFDLFLRKCIEEVAKEYKPEKELSAFQRARVWKRILTPGRLYTDVEEIPYAVQGVKSLAKVSDVYFCTSPMKAQNWCFDRQNWLKDRFDKLAGKIVFTKHKFLVYGDILVDDKIKNIDSWKEAHPRGCGVLWTSDKVSAGQDSWDALIEDVKLITK
jgi:5'(3')-deoxyribonucleotidase